MLHISRQRASITLSEPVCPLRHLMRSRQVHETFDYVLGRAVTSLPKFVGFVENNLRPNNPAAERHSHSLEGDVKSEGGKLVLERGVLYMRGEATAKELAQLGTQPSNIIPLDVDALDPPDGSGQERGYSKVFHFSSESIWGRTPARK